MKNKTEKWKTQQRTLAKGNKSKLDKFRQKRDLDNKKRIKHEENLKLAKLKQEQKDAQ